MTTTRGALLALPTVLALTLGGAAWTAGPAIAAPSPVAERPAELAPGPEAGPERTPEPVPADPAGPPAPEPSVAPTPAPSPEEAEPVAPAPAPAPVPVAVDGQQQAVAEPLVLTSPAVGELRRDLQLRLGGEAVGAARIRWSSPDVEGLRGDELVTADRFTAVTDLPSDVPTTFTVTVVALDAEGVERGRVDRLVAVDVPRSPAVTITSPAQGAVLLSDPIRWGPGAAPTVPDWGTFRVTGTGTPGQYLALGLEALDLDSDFGTDGPAVRVGADGRWVLDIARPFGTWRVSVAQFALEDVREEDGWTSGRVTSRLSPDSVVDVRLVASAAPGDAPALPAGTPATALPVGTTTTLVPTAAAPHRRSLASTGTDASTGAALLTGLLLAGVGAAGVALGGRRRSARREGVRG